MADCIGREKAQAVVERISRKYGLLSEAILSTMLPHVRRQVEEAMLNKDTKIGGSVKTLAKNLYTSKSRFVFELLQNAEDNQFKRAQEAGTKPYVSFQMHPQKIIVECNEDGFTEKNLEAISSVGETSKTGGEGYIGEKGIGFKSVFMVAWKVHIQSGSFSFSFTHRHDDPGIGMLAPVWESAIDDSLAPSVTRITLYLHEDDRADVQQTILKQFREIPENVLLFTKKLRQIKVAFFDNDGEPTSNTVYDIERPSFNKRLLRTTTGDNTRTTKHFHVTTYEATGLAKNTNRTYSTSEEAVQSYSKSEVVLAFPLSETTTPIINPQDLFVFLPVRPVGFSFIIQADFVTEASRQDIVTDSSRNIGLLDCIASAFITAVSQMCSYETLRYQWMRYLPQRDLCTGPLWAKLCQLIFEKLKSAPVLFRNGNAVLLHANCLLRLPDSFLDEFGVPLLGGELDFLVSNRYEKADLDLLRDYGPRCANFTDFVAWLAVDLSKTAWPCTKARPAVDKWHSRVASYLCKELTGIPAAEQDARKMTLRKIPLIPLEGGEWVSLQACDVFFPQTANLDIPTDIGLRLVAKSALSEARVLLFRLLGVKTATNEFVHEKILDRYESELHKSRLNNDFLGLDLTLAASKEHLHFLYQTDHLVDESYEHICVQTVDKLWVIARSASPYIIDDDPYGPYEVCRGLDSSPGFPLHFISEAYMTDSPAKLADQDLSWREWLHEKLDFRQHLKLNGAIIEYVERNKPEKLVGIAWRHYKDYGGLSSDLSQRLCESEVPCGRQYEQWKHSFFPTIEHQRLVERFLDPDAYFPWLWLDEKEHPKLPYETIPPDWRGMLAMLQGQSLSPDLCFSLSMLQYSCANLSNTAPDAASCERLFSLYEHILVKYRETKDETDAELIRNVFSNSHVFVPQSNSQCIWTLPSDCVWEGDIALRSKCVLEPLYRPYLKGDKTRRLCVENLFRDVLKIPNSTWRTYVGELEYLKGNGDVDVAKLTRIYKALNGLCHSMSATDTNSLKQLFEEHRYIVVPTEKATLHCAPSDCVWSSAARLRGHVSLNDTFGDLEHFFVDVLGVKPVDLTMAIGDLEKGARLASTSVEEIKDSVWAVNTLLLGEDVNAVGRLDSGLPVFPVKGIDGSVMRMAHSTDFCVVDRKPLYDAFQNKVRLLDFSVKEVAQLQPFITWARLGDRYLSARVTECTSFSGDDATQVDRREKRLRRRAYAFLRIAAHFDSPRTVHKSEIGHFYEALRNINVYEADDISSGLQIIQDKQTIKVKGRRVTLHLEEKRQDGSSPNLCLDIYLPRNKAEQEYAYASGLPQKLFAWMMSRADSEALTKTPLANGGIDAVRTILAVPYSLMEHALDDNGISTSDVVNVDSDDNGDDDGDGSKQSSGSHSTALLHAPTTPPRNRAARADSSSAKSTPNSRRRGYGFDDSPSSAAEVFIFDTPATSVGAASPARDRGKSSAATAIVPFSPSPRWPQALGSAAGTGQLLETRLPSPDPAASEMRKYVSLLSRTIVAARHSEFQKRGAFDMSALGDVLATIARREQVDLGLNLLSQFERDCRIGAAGELYVFELLSHVASHSLGFSRENWQSTMRKYVTAHPDYADMLPWTGRETSDLVYEDTQGRLTALLVEMGYLDQSRQSQQFTYNIEVKTTTMSCETPFYMSKAQYERMRRNTLKDGTATLPQTIYVIFRVYNLGRSNVNVRVYVDPERLRLDEKLNFTAERWSIVPSFGS